MICIFFGQVRTQSAPDTWSWVQQGGISSIKNQAPPNTISCFFQLWIINLFQGQCGSCAAFATVAILETWWETLMCNLHVDRGWGYFFFGWLLKITFWIKLTPPPPPSFWQQRGVMFDDLSEQHIVSFSPVFIFINLAVYYNHQWYVTRFCSSFDILRCWIWKAIVFKYHRD